MSEHTKRTLCPEYVEMGALDAVTCDLPAGHGGMHYDNLLNMTWECDRSVAVNTGTTR